MLGAGILTKYHVSVAPASLNMAFALCSCCVCDLFRVIGSLNHCVGRDVGRGSGFRVSGLGFRVSGLGFRV